MEHAISASLSPVQAQVALSLASGASLSKAAQSVGVGRSTVYAWLQNEPNFSSAVEQAKSEFVITLRDQIRDLAAKALSTLEAIRKDAERTSAPNRDRQGPVPPELIRAEQNTSEHNFAISPSRSAGRLTWGIGDPGGGAAGAEPGQEHKGSAEKEERHDQPEGVGFAEVLDDEFVGG